MSVVVEILRASDTEYVMVMLDLSSEEWESIPAPVQNKLLNYFGEGSYV